MEKDDSIYIDRTFQTSVEKVWEAWTNPALVMRWFGSDPNGKVLKADLDVKPGARFKVTFKDSDGTEHTCNGVYDVVEKFKRLTFSWAWQNEPGVESFVTIGLIAEGGGTRMQFQHANLGFASKHNYLKGWKSTFEKLEKILRE